MILTRVFSRTWPPAKCRKKIFVRHFRRTREGARGGVVSSQWRGFLVLVDGDGETVGMKMHDGIH